MPRHLRVHAVLLGCDEAQALVERTRTVAGRDLKPDATTRPGRLSLEVLDHLAPNAEPTDVRKQREVDEHGYDAA